MSASSVGGRATSCHPTAGCAAVPPDDGAARSLLADHQAVQPWVFARREVAAWSEAAVGWSACWCAGGGIARDGGSRRPAWSCRAAPRAPVRTPADRCGHSRDLVCRLSMWSFLANDHCRAGAYPCVPGGGRVQGVSGWLAAAGAGAYSALTSLGLALNSLPSACAQSPISQERAGGLLRVGRRAPALGCAGGSRACRCTPRCRDQVSWRVAREAPRPVDRRCSQSAAGRRQSGGALAPPLPRRLKARVPSLMV